MQIILSICIKFPESHEYDEYVSFEHGDARMFAALNWFLQYENNNNAPRGPVL